MKNVLHKKIRGIISLKFYGEGHMGNIVKNVFYRNYLKSEIFPTRSLKNEDAAWVRLCSSSTKIK